MQYICNICHISTDVLDSAVAFQCQWQSPLFCDACGMVQMQEESEELLDDAEKDEELAAAEAQAAAAAAKAAAAVAAFRQAGSRQQAYQQGRQASQNVQDLLAKAQSSINPQLLPDVVAERQLKQQQQKQLLQQQRQQEELARRAGDSLYEEAKLGPFGPAVAKANALRKQMRQPLQRVEGEGELMVQLFTHIYVCPCQWGSTL
jgi:hypothetical protein